MGDQYRLLARAAPAPATHRDSSAFPPPVDSLAHDEKAPSVAATKLYLEAATFPAAVLTQKARSVSKRFVAVVVASLFAFTHFALLNFRSIPTRPHLTRLPINADTILARCRTLHAKPVPPGPEYYARRQSDRFEPGTRAVLLRNATIWTGRADGLEVVRGDMLMDGGVIVSVGDVPAALLVAGEYDVLDVAGAWVTPGLVDMHAHFAVDPAPVLSGARDGNSNRGLVLPFLRAVDALNTHDEGFINSMSGGVTTALVIPGSTNGIGGQGFTIKLRPTKERSSSAMLVDSPLTLNGSAIDYEAPLRWRHMKHACGENPSRYFDVVRMDTVWAVRQIYDQARQIKNAQDGFCERALAGEWEGLGNFPEDLALEALVDILRGRFKVQTHCYEAVDIDYFVRLTQEFQFPVSAFHHAHETYLVPDLLKKAYDHAPGSAIFSSFSRYKREAYRHSTYAARILADNGLKVAMKSDHPAIPSRFLLHEAQLAHYAGLSTGLALASVTTTPAELIGLSHRVGLIKPGYDADVVVWDSHPLALGAAPTQVYVDGIPQLSKPFSVKKPASSQHAPKTPNFDRERADAIKYEGLPPLEPEVRTPESILFRNVSSLLVDGFASFAAPGDVLVKEGVIVAVSGASALDSRGARIVDLEGGSISPAMVSVGTIMGLEEMWSEDSTGDGAVFDPLMGHVPSILGEDTLIQAYDGLQFGSRNALLAYREGVATAIEAPKGYKFMYGLSTSFSLAARHKLEKGAVVQEIAALHVSVTMGNSDEASVSTQIATLRRLLLDPPKSYGFKQVVEGTIPLVVDVNSADIIASLLALKRQVEHKHGNAINVTLFGGSEAHLLAKEIAEANVGVVLAPARSFPHTWEKRRILPGPPLSAESSAAYLHRHGITVGLAPQGIEGLPLMTGWAVHNLRFDAGWVFIESGGAVSKEAALAMVSTNLEKLLGVSASANGSTEFAATKGGDLFSFESKVVAMISGKRGLVDLL
ncbi:unnamed protein product [Mycena citricolor]|uniref:Amidohydrolase-related domain-containing protein n=1 Tax=Mycena citricolor TaxID=2018698 RepID=A0AAD2HXH0_9AGAR|nr:unnamed protein product [Mycena citricolor]